MSEFEDKKASDAPVASDGVNLIELITNGSNPRGIPSARFMVCDFCLQHKKLVFFKLVACFL